MFVKKADATCPLFPSVCALALAAAAIAADTPSERGYIDRELFPKGYGILTSDRLMFPDNVSDWPVKIDSYRQLFIDDYLIASMEGLTREFHQPVKHPKNPLLVPDQPWEGKAIWVGSVLRDQDTGRFRMWYGSRAAGMYAESSDGIGWHKPELGIVEYEGSRRNNILMEGGGLSVVMVEAEAPRAERRYTAIAERRAPKVKKTAFFLFHSADGLHWTGDFNRPVLPRTWNPALSMWGVGDTSIFRYDPLLGRYVCDAKFQLRLPEFEAGLPPGWMRFRGMIESEDLVHWTRPRVIIFPDEGDEPDSQIYANISFVYENMWLGLLRVMHTQRTGWKQVEIELSYSRDGRNWSRPGERKTFIPLGEADSWEPDYSDPAHNGPLLVGDELWFYYRGCRNKERDKAEDWAMSIGLARLRRDGFASLSAGLTPGRVITRPLTFSGRSLFVNAEVDDGGWVKAAVLSRDSQPVRPHALEDSVPLTVGAVRARMTWSAAKTLVLPGDGHPRLLFEMKNARLYSFWIE